MPAPHVRDAVWYYASEGQAAGPVTLAQLLDAVPERIPIDTPVWSPWTNGWVPAGQVPALAARDYWHDDEPSYLAWYFFWPYLTFRDALKSLRPQSVRSGLSGDRYIALTLDALVIALIAGGVALAAADETPRVAALIATVGAALALAVTLLATMRRLRDVGQKEQRALLMLVPGLNLIQWVGLLSARGASDRPARRPPQLSGPPQLPPPSGPA
jgi:hypothetical protein